MSHKEGGWPAAIDPNEAYDVNRLKKKMEKESRLTTAVPYLTGVMKDCIRQNNQIDLFEEYFVNEPVEHFVEQLSLKTLMLFKFSFFPYIQRPIRPHKKIDCRYFLASRRLHKTCCRLLYLKIPTNAR